VKVRVLSPALEEIAEAAKWYESQRAGLGSEFWKAVDTTLVEIDENPRRFGTSEFATADSEIRFAIFRRFRCVVHFLVEQDECQVVSVAHGARQPGYRLRRK